MTIVKMLLAALAVTPAVLTGQTVSGVDPVDLLEAA